jgi:hypothetical protein
VRVIEVTDEKTAENDLQKFKTKYAEKMFAIAEGEAVTRKYKEKVSEITISTSKSEVPIDSKRKHFIFYETVNSFGISENIKIVAYLTP